VSVLVLFLDGVGLGEPDASFNPFARATGGAIYDLLGGPLVLRGIVDRPGALLVPTDCTLGVAGLPQSATGQTALLTGVNAPAMVGRHVTAYPTTPLRTLLQERSLFAVLRQRGSEVALANAYSPEYHAAIAARRLKMAAVTYAAWSAGVRLRTLDDLRAGGAIFHDLTNRRLRQWGHDVPEMTPRDCGRRLAAIAAEADLTFFEFFLSDLAAHGRLLLSSDAVVAMLDELLAGVLDAAGERTTIILISDHGNLEDDRSTTHTTNPVPTLVIGPGREALRRVRALTDVAPAILALLERGSGIAPPPREPTGAGMWEIP
jgi:hypothetical protein